jgi:prefoldin subunit 5
MNIKMSNELVNKNIAALQTAITLVEKRLEETYSGVDQLLLNSFIIETREVIAVLEDAKAKNDEVIVFSYAPSPEA